MFEHIEISPTEIGASCTAAVMMGWAAFERWRNSRTKEGIAIAEQSTNLAKVWENQSEAYKASYDREHGEYTAYREAAHKKAGEDQVLMASLNARILDLTAKTDVTPFIEFQRQQAAINENLLKGSTQILVLLERITEKLDAHP